MILLSKISFFLLLFCKYTDVIRTGKEKRKINSCLTRIKDNNYNYAVASRKKTNAKRACNGSTAALSCLRYDSVVTLIPRKGKFGGGTEQKGCKNRENS